MVTLYHRRGKNDEVKGKGRFLAANNIKQKESEGSKAGDLKPAKGGLIILEKCLVFKMSRKQEKQLLPTKRHLTSTQRP